MIHLQIHSLSVHVVLSDSEAETKGIYVPVKAILTEVLVLTVVSEDAGEEWFARQSGVSRCWKSRSGRNDGRDQGPVRMERS